MNIVTIINKISVQFNNQYGGICPRCGCTKVTITHSRPWADGMKIRYHKCECGQNFSSIQDADPISDKTKVLIQSYKGKKHSKSRKKRKSHAHKGKKV